MLDVVTTIPFPHVMTQPAQRHDAHVSTSAIQCICPALGIGALAGLSRCLVELDLAYCYQINGVTLEALTGLQSLNLHWRALLHH